MYYGGVYHNYYHRPPRGKCDHHMEMCSHVSYRQQYYVKTKKTNFAELVLTLDSVHYIDG